MYAVVAMTLTSDDHAYVVETACDLLRHRQRGRLIQILEARQTSSDGYADERERELDRIVLAIAHVIDDELAEPS